MIYSRRKGLVFIHIQRTGGTSLGNLLVRELPGARRMGFEHSNAAAALRTLGHKEFYRCFRFAFVRNPWDRLLSWFHRSKQGGRVSKRRFNVRRSTTFAAFLATPHPWLSMPQLDYLRNARGELLVDHIYRFENYRADVADLCRRFGVDASALPHSKGSIHANYVDYYTDATRQIVADRFAEDIACFGYTFGA